MKKICQIYFFLVCLTAPFCLFAQYDVKNTGNVKKAKITDNQIELITENAFVNVLIYSPSVIRVRIANTPFKDDFSYAVISKPESKGLIAEQNADTINFQTDSLKGTISKNPFSIAFYTKDGKVINEDEKGLSTSWIGTEVTTYKKMQEWEKFLGLGEKTGNIDRSGNAYTNWNSDVYGYSVSQDPLYSSIPFYIGTHHGLYYGIFLDNTFQTDFNFGASNNRFSSFGAKGGEMNYYFIYNSSVAGIIKSYTDLTGRMSLPPLWSLGYQQNRYSYYPDTEVFRIAQTLREKKIPADGITLDIHYMDNYKLFTWDKQRFPNPKAMIGKLNDMGFKTTVIVDPGIKVEKGYPAYENGLQKNIFLKYSDGQNYTGQVWPGWCHFPDFTSVKGRDWWKGQVKNFADSGVAGIWNDMNEISTWGQKMPGNVLFDYDGHPTTHLQGHNVFALEMARSSFEGAKTTFKKRPFILTRSGYAGLQRYTAIWTGDNRAEDDHMLAGVRLLNSLGLSGVSFTGMDIGGFTGNGTAALFSRWIQLGTFIPYFRSHTGYNAKSAEPWTFGEDVLEISRKYISLRYKLLPYIYSSFYESTQNGMPVMRSLAIDYTNDIHIYNPAYQNQYFFGQAFLVLPQESNKQLSKIYLPQGKWYDLYTGKSETGGQEKLIELSQDKLPVYVRESSIIPMQSIIQSTNEKPSDTLIVHIYKGSIANTFIYYEDDGETYRYEQGDFYKRSIQFNPDAKTIIFDKPEGHSTSKFKYMLLTFHGFEETTMQLNDKKTALTNGHMSFLSITPAIAEQKDCEIKTILLNNTNEKIILYF